jgi:hypothetical protein
MKIGDLVCYNVAGQKNKSMALVVGFDKGSRWEKKCVQLMWVLLPEVGPCIQRAHQGNQYISGSFSCLFRQYNKGIMKDNIVLWHTIGDWFEVVQ